MVLNDLPPKQMNQHDHSRRVRDDYAVLDMKLLRPGREDARRQNRKVRAFGKLVGPELPREGV